MSCDALKDLANLVLGRLPQRSGLYADVRVVWRRHEKLSLVNAVPEACVATDDLGVGLRVHFAGHWGFAATSNLKNDYLDRMIEKALASAGAAAYISRGGDSFSPPPTVCATYSTPVAIDPTSVSWDDRISLLYRASTAMLAEKSVERTTASMDIFKETKVFVATTGSVITQTIVHCGAGIAAYATDGRLMQVRSYPCSFGGNYHAGGYEFILGLELEAHAPRVAAEAAELLTAPVCPAGRTNVILDSSQLALQIHESIGHAVELDRILGHEASFAGTSFVAVEMVGNFSYGSPLVNVTADATVEGGLGSFAFDDEGVRAQAAPIIREGKLVGVLDSCSTASVVGREPMGAMRADGWQHFPLVRMTNINLEPHSGTLEELIGSTEEGLWLETNRSWSIDDKRLHFQFATELAREIKKGKLGRLYRNPVYSGTTPAFWRACDYVCGASEWRLWGVPNCGKGEPMQVARVGHGCPPARFKNVEVGGID